ncbi:MAG: FAD-dependent oxidoreductase [Acidobacteriota bacterium]|nr:MAG: FAD-dependent oxidoreductase [Acidobacteriota bacterium]
MREVIIIGGGFAGLAAAVDLAEQGIPVRLLERRSFLGGRAYSFRDKVTGDAIDNGQHLMMGCYHRTLDFLEKIGSTHLLRFQSGPRVDFLDERKGPAGFICPPLPAPLHLLGGLARLKTLTWPDRISALRVGLALRGLNGNGHELSRVTVREWLDSLGQSERIQQRFWNVVALATLNERPEVASADMFARVLDQAFMHRKTDSTMVISKIGLSELYTVAARDYVESRGGAVQLEADVARLEFEDGRCRALQLRNGETIEPAAVISAVPYFALRRMIDPEVRRSSPSLGTLEQLSSSPIVSINLWYRRPVTDLEFVGLLDSPIEWVFNRSSISGMPNRTPQHLALVISGAHQPALLPKDELIHLAVNEMNRFFPEARNQNPLHAFVIREIDATLSHGVGVAALRPGCRTEFSNFFLAGDWTATGLPPTIEGAVQSGQLAARELSGQI